MIAGCYGEHDFMWADYLTFTKNLYCLYISYLIILRSQFSICLLVGVNVGLRGYSKGSQSLLSKF